MGDIVDSSTDARELADGPVTVTVYETAAEGPSRTIDAQRRGDALAFTAADIEAVTGWHLTVGGLCRGDRCVPLPPVASPSIADTHIPIDTATRVLGIPAAFDADAGLVVLGTPPSDRAAQLARRCAPSITLPTTGGTLLSLESLRGRKTLLIAWASWCGCRYDLPQWQSIADELRAHGLDVIGVAVDDDVADVRPWVDDVGIRFPVVVDRDHILVEAFAMTHVPTVVWLDEELSVVRPNTVAFADDTFTSVHGVRAAPHLDALRNWVVHGDTGPGRDDEAAPGGPTFDAQLARAEFRLAVLLHRAGSAEAAARHFDAAASLAPDDFTIRRASMPLRGQNPFGPEFFSWYEEWRARGEPGYDHMD